ncbi:ribonuclease H-like domain-containing protein [Natrinema salifodinae]|uniref:Helix-hairpin-helix domain-containing protein n=1 Tax=Natrinema salifodinae TaxID=1202768 RepID=A0A1I0LYB3_9EURY|nr:ribonuclease H-like domain-containing protein [Natrinema salifodinae]SEV80661.1 Helix-hairpin-helix domain-containing protein [Natrinema salifodinae]
MTAGTGTEPGAGSETETGGDLLALRCDAVADLADAALRDALEYFDPDLVYVVREASDVRIVSRLRRAFDGPVVFAGGPADVRTETVADVTVAFASAASLLEEPPEPAARADYVVCDDLEPTTDAVALEATLEGRREIARYQRRTGGSTTFLSGALPASYDHVWDATVDGDRVRLPVRGVAPLRRSGAVELARLTCDRGGGVAVSSAPADRFGLQALDGVGPTTADRLRTHGYETRAAVADAAETDLREIAGIGAATARELLHSARALAESRVVRRTDEPVPPTAETATPLFVDIETDGLRPTIIWLIGVYDPERDAYVDFVDADPSRDEPGAATREFVSWLAAEYERPSLIAWNGYGFDYEHLDRFVVRYAPEYREYWRDRVQTYDPYDWAVRRDNAVLPGRTNRLETVAAALGCARSGPAAALDGRSLAKRIRRLLEDSSVGSADDAGAVEPTGTAGAAESDADAGIDWDAARRYCEADVRELAAVFDAIAAAEPEPNEDDGAEEATNGSTADSTTQTGLADF